MFRSEIQKRLEHLNLDPAREAEIIDELAQHLEDRYRELLASGLTPSEAIRLTVDEISDPDLESRLRRVERSASHPQVVLGANGRRNAISDLWQDVRFGLRMLRKSPGVTAIAVLTLALGIGANTAIFSVVNGILLRPLPYSDPQRLAIVRLDWRGTVGHPGLAPAEVLDLREQASAFEGFEAITPNSSSLTGEDMEKIPSATITEGFFGLLGVAPLLGSGTSFDEEGGKNSVWEVVISYELWQRRFGGDREIIGSKISVNNFRPRVSGVLPKGFRMHLNSDTDLPEQIDLFFLGSLTEDGAAPDRANHDFTVIGRLKSNVTFGQAQNEVDAISGDMTRQYPKAYSDSNLRFHLVPLHQDLVRNSRPAILALFGAVGFVLLIACANVANLILTRTEARSKEIAIRCALGAQRARVIAQLITENLLLSLIAGAAGLLIASEAIKILAVMHPANLPRLNDVRIDGFVMCITLLVSLAAGVVLGLIPALRAMRTDLNEVLKDGNRRIAGSPSWLQNALVILEVALSLVLLTGAGLMIRTFANLNRYDWGFNADRLLTMKVNLNPRTFKDVNQRVNFYQLAAEKLRALPGVRVVSGAWPLPLDRQRDLTTFALDDVDAAPLSALRHTVLPDYFDAMGIRMLAGRDFTMREIEERLPVVVVDEVLAKRISPNDNPVGRKLLMRPHSRQQQWLEVIGVVSHVKEGGIHDDGTPQLYLSYTNYPIYDLSMVARGSTDLLPQATTMKKEIEDLGTQRPVHTFRPMSGYVDDELDETRFVLALMSSLGITALILSLVGLYSVVSYSVSRRTHEIGIRMALGAQAGQVLKLIARQALGLTVTGVVIGLLGAFALTRVLDSLLIGVSATDPGTFLVMSVVFTAVGLLACYIPARRATRVDPMIALREE